MIYRDCEYPSVLTPAEDRDSVTYDELIRALEERPSNVIYIERDGMRLDYWRRHCKRWDRETRHVPANTKFISVHPKEYMRVRQVFSDKENIRSRIHNRRMPDG